MARILNLNCVMKLSKILKKMGIKKYIKELLSENMETMLQEVKKASKKEEPTEIDTEKAMNDQKMIIALDVFGWIFENMSDAEDEFIELFVLFSGEPDKAVRNWDIDKTLEVFKEMFVNGIPKVLRNLIDVDEVKKKLSTMMQ